MSSSTPPPPPPESYAPPAPPKKKKKKIFLWVFLAIQVLFIVWIISALASNGGTATDCGSLSQEACESAEDVGTGIGVILIIGLWMVVDFFLAVIYGVYRLAKRD